MVLKPLRDLHANEVVWQSFEVYKSVFFSFFNHVYFNVFCVFFLVIYFFFNVFMDIFFSIFEFFYTFLRSIFLIFIFCN